MAPMDIHSVSPQWWWLLWIHTLSLLNNYVSHGSPLFNPQWWWVPWLHTLYPSIMMAPVAPSNLSPLNDDGSLIMKSRWWGNFLYIKGQLALLGDYLRLNMQRDSIRRYIATLDPYLVHPSSRRFLFLSLIWYPYPTFFQSPMRPFAYWGLENYLHYHPYV